MKVEIGGRKGRLRMLKLKVFILAAVAVFGVLGVGVAFASGKVPLVGGVASYVTDAGSASGNQYGGNGGSASGNQYAGDDENAVEDQYGEMDDESASQDQYGEEDEHGDDVSEMARDHEATETRTLPNGHEVENHGQAVREAAHGDDEDAVTPPANTGSANMQTTEGGQYQPSSGTATMPTRTSRHHD